MQILDMMSRASPQKSPPLSKTLVEAAYALAHVLNGHRLTKSISQTTLTPAAQHWCYETLRRYAWVQAQIRPYLHIKISSKRSGLPALLSDQRVEALLLIASSLLASHRYHHALVINETVKATRQLTQKRNHIPGLVNAVLQAKLRDQDSKNEDKQPITQKISSSDEEVQYWHPAWWIQAMRQQYGAEYKAILEANNLHPPLTLRVNQARGTLEEMLKRLSAAHIHATPITTLRVWDAKTQQAYSQPLTRAPALIESLAAIHVHDAIPVNQIPGFYDGCVSIQDAAAQRAMAHLQLNRPGLRVLDACAAPGGKSGHIAESLTCLHQRLATDKPIALTALEKDPIRAQRIIENRDRLGFRFTVITGDLMDASHWWDGQPFDRILLDVPCTASGSVKRHPDSKWLLRKNDAKRQAKNQQQLLNYAMPMLHPQGKLVYSTCSLFDTENIEVIKAVCRSIFLSYGHHETILPSRLHDGHFFITLHKNIAS